jgi:biotin carboxyl carrier protein
VTTDVEAGGRTYRISIDQTRSGGPGDLTLRVTVAAAGADDAAGSPLSEAIDCRPTDLGFMLRFADGRVVDVAATERPGGWLIQLPRVSVPVSVDGRRAGSGAGTSSAAAGEQRVLAPMPGRVVRVLVKAGDAVEARQGLVVVEAMKMENELTSPKAGRVKEVAVSEGGSVEAGRLLVVVE